MSYWLKEGFGLRIQMGRLVLYVSAVLRQVGASHGQFSESTAGASGEEQDAPAERDPRRALPGLCRT